MLRAFCFRVAAIASRKSQIAIETEGDRPSHRSRVLARGRAHSSFPLHFYKSDRIR